MKSWTHKFVATRDCPSLGYGPGATITVTAGLSKLEGNARPYFSVTADIVTPKSRRRHDIEAGGCMHAEILKYWPKLAPVVALHLADDTGTPMHAEGNGWYFLAGYYGGAGEDYHYGNSKGQHGGEYRFPTPEECLQTFADHVRIDLEAARVLADRWRRDTPDLVRKGGRALMAEWIKASAGRWQREADAACVLLDSLGVKTKE